jgi:hypothetical protein
MVNEERHGVNPLRGSARQSFASAKKCFFVWYDQKKIGLMDLPHLMDNAARCPQALGQAVLAHNSTAPTTARDFISGRNERKEPSGFHRSAAQP